MTVTIPESVTAEGNVKVVYIPTLVSRTAPSAAALNGGTAVDISCYLLPDWGGITGDQSIGDDRRFCSKETFQRLGRVTRSITPLTYTYLPQQNSAHAGNKAKTALAPGNTGFLVLRFGIAVPTTFTVADVVESIPVECGMQNFDVVGADEFSPLTITQTLGATGVMVEGIVAA